MSSAPPADPKTIQNRFFRHFGRFWSSNSDLSVGQAGAICENALARKINVRSSPRHANATLSEKKHIFQLGLPRGIDAKTEIGRS